MCSFLGKVALIGSGASESVNRHVSPHSPDHRLSPALGGAPERGYVLHLSILGRPPSRAPPSGKRHRAPATSVDGWSGLPRTSAGGWTGCWSAARRRRHWPAPPGCAQRVAPMLGDAAALVDRVEFHPAKPPDGPPLPPRPPPHGSGPDGRPRSRRRVVRAQRRARAAAAGRTAAGPALAAPPPAPPQVIVVDVQEAIEEAKRVVRTEVAGARRN